MANGIGVGVLLWAATVGSGVAAPERGPGEPASELCAGCLEVCSPPLSHADELLEASTHLYLPAAARAIATAAAIDLAVELERVHRGYAGGHFGSAYEAHAREVEALARTCSETGHATSREIRSLKSVRAALYADTVVGLRALARDAPAQAFLAEYRAREAVLEGVLTGLSSAQPMRAAERRAVCQVLVNVR